MATQLFVTRWQLLAQEGTAKPNCVINSTADGTGEDPLSRQQRFPKPKVTGSSPVGTARSFHQPAVFKDLFVCLCNEDAMFVTLAFTL